MLAALLLAAAASRAAAEARLAALDRQRRAQEARLAAEEAPLAHLLATAERLAMRPPALTLARPESADDMVHTRALIAALAPEIRRRTATVRRAMIATQALSAATEQQLAALLEQRDTGEDARTKDRIERLAALPAPTFPARQGTAERVYRLPTAGTVVVGMGEKSDVGLRARGVTLATRPGAMVAAPALGRVAYAGPFRGYGDIVILDHGHGWTTLLAGMELVTAAPGALIAQGAALGHMGRTDPRLTIELRHDGGTVDVVAILLQ